MFEIKNLLRYYSYKIFAQHKFGHGIHSPFLFDFITDILNEQGKWYAQDSIISIRKKMFQNSEYHKIIQYKIFSENSKSSKNISPNQITNSLFPTKFENLLFRIVKKFNPRNILELGTSFGLGTFNLAIPNPKSKVHTFEQCQNTAHFFATLFEQLKLSNVTQYTGNYSELLSDIFPETNKVDLIFVNNHLGKQPIKTLFELCLPYCHQNSIFLFDNIHRTAIATSNWTQITEHQSVTLSVDLFRCGLVFLNPDLSKQNFIIKF